MAEHAVEPTAAPCSRSLGTSFAASPRSSCCLQHSRRELKSEEVEPRKRSLGAADTDRNFEVVSLPTCAGHEHAGAREDEAAYSAYCHNCDFRAVATDDRTLLWQEAHSSREKLRAATLAHTPSPYLSTLRVDTRDVDEKQADTLDLLCDQARHDHSSGSVTTEGCHRSAAYAGVQAVPASIPRSFWQAMQQLARAFVRVLWDSGTASVLLAAMAFSVSALLIKLLHGRIPVFEVVVVRSGLSLGVCVWTAHVAKISPMFGARKNRAKLIARGAFGGVAMSAYYFSIDRLPLADAVTLFFLNPAVTALAAWAIMGERLGWRGVLGVAVSLAGLVLLTRPTFLFGGPAWSGMRVLGTFFGLVAALASAGAFIMIRYIGHSESALVMSQYFHMCSLALSLMPLAVGFPRTAVAPNAAQVALLVAISATSFAGQILIGRAFQLLSAARASALNFTQVIYSYAFALLFLHESISLMGVGGSALLAAGVVLVNLRAPKPADATPKVDGTTAGPATAKSAGSQELSEIVMAGTPRLLLKQGSISGATSEVGKGVGMHVAGHVRVGPDVEVTGQDTETQPLMSSTGH